MYCKNCGKELKDSKFCPYCGERVTDKPNYEMKENFNRENTTRQESTGNKEGNKASLSKKLIILGIVIFMIIVAIVGIVVFPKNKKDVPDKEEVEVSKQVEEDTKTNQDAERDDPASEKENIETEDVKTSEITDEEQAEDKSENNIMETPKLQEVKCEYRIEGKGSKKYQLARFDDDGDVVYQEHMSRFDGEEYKDIYNYTYLLDENGNKTYGLIPKKLSCGALGTDEGPLMLRCYVSSLCDGVETGNDTYEYVYDDKYRLVNAKYSYVGYAIKGFGAYQINEEQNFTYDNNVISCYQKIDHDNGWHVSERTWKEKYDQNNHIIEVFDQKETDSLDNITEEEDIKYSYDEQGRLIGENLSNKKYDEQGKVIHNEMYNGDSFYSLEEYEYDEQGRKTKYYLDGYYTKYYNYDENNLCVSINCIAESPASDPERVINAKNQGYATEVEYTFSYDEKKRLIKAEVCDMVRESSGQLWSDPYCVTIEYDENNLPICLKSDNAGTSVLSGDIIDILKEQYSEETKRVLFYLNDFGIGDYSYVTY